MPINEGSPTKLKHPVVVIFGAGASRGGLDGTPSAPPPVDKDFFDIANQLSGHGTPKLAKKVLNDVWQLYRKTNGVGLEAYYRDLETRAIIGKFAKTANQPKDRQRRQKELEELIRRVYVHTTVHDTRASTVKPKTSGIHKNILEKLKEKDTICPSFAFRILPRRKRSVIFTRSYSANNPFTPWRIFSSPVFGDGVVTKRTSTPFSRSSSMINS